MLIIPLGSPADRSFRPWITIALVLLCTLIYFGPQGQDHRRDALAAQHYLSSALPAIEFPLYAQELDRRKAQDRPDAKDAAKAAQSGASFAQLAQRNAPLALHLMQSDSAFMQALHAGQLIGEQDARHASWKSLRGEYERLAGRSVTRRFGFVPNEFSLVTLLTHQFLHGDVSHLLGNMAVLLLIGRLVEATLGRWRYLACYLLAGAAGAAVFAYFAAGSGSPLVGASGAISGVMGMYAVLLGWRRVEFFYSVIVYFGFFTAPAIAVLPVWIANELYQFWANSDAQVAFMAHAGGLAAGALLALPFRRRRTLEIRGIDGKTHDAAARPAPPSAWQRAQKLLGEARLDEALPLLAEAAAAQADDVGVLRAYYNVARRTPGSEHFHRAAARLLHVPSALDQDGSLAHATYLEYASLAKPAPRLDSELALALVRRFARHGHRAEAERLLVGLLRNAPEHAALPRAVLDVGRSLHTGDDPARGLHYLRLVLELFPNSPEASVSRQILPKSGA